MEEAGGRFRLPSLDRSLSVCINFHIVMRINGKLSCNISADGLKKSLHAGITLHQVTKMQCRSERGAKGGVIQGDTWGRHLDV